MESDNLIVRKWRPLALAAATHTFAAAIPISCMPALFAEISADLDLSLTQIGAAWGMLGLAGVVVSLYGGILGDRFGVKRVLILLCLLGGIAGASRALSFNFVSLIVTVFAFGIISAMMPINVHKAVNIWFKGHSLSSANGIVSMGMGLGLMLGPMLSATLLSPLFGGWRWVLVVFGTMSLLIGLLWLLVRNESTPAIETGEMLYRVSLREGVAGLLRIKSVWLIGMSLLFRNGCIMGFVGYLPLYLRGRGWDAVQADGALAGFYAISMLSVIPMAMLSNQLRSRKYILYAAAVIAVLGMGLIPLVNGIITWILVLAVGMFMDAYMSVAITFTQEIRELNPLYSGLTLGLLFTFAQFGAFASPPLGNNLASYNAGLPLLFWAFISLCNVIILLFIREEKRQVKPALIEGKTAKQSL